MKEELVIYEAQKAQVVPKGRDYIVSPFGDKQIELKRGQDFGIPEYTNKKDGTKKKAFDKPILYKAGAEKIAIGYGLLQHYELVSLIERPDPAAPLFHYVFRCDLVKIYNGTEYIITSGFGSANSEEKRNGFASAFDVANTAVKMAKKRALVDAVISLGGLSDIFTQDLENNEFMAKATEFLKEDDPKKKITPQQVKRLFAIAHEAGLTSEQAKQRIKAMGFNSTKDITQEKYNDVCEALEALIMQKTEAKNA